MRLDLVPQVKAAPLVILPAIATVGMIGFAGSLFYLLEEALRNIDYNQAIEQGIQQAAISEPTHSYSPVQEVEGPYTYTVCLEQCAKMMGGKGKLFCFLICAPALLGKGLS